MNKPAIHNITDTLGADAICAALDVTPHSIRHARTTGLFPASWYDALYSMCDEIGIPCPRSAFNWKAAAKKHGVSARRIQDNPAQKARSEGAA